MLFGCFFNSHFVFVSGKHISFLNACAFGFAVINLIGNDKRSVFFLSQFERYGVDLKNWTVPIQDLYAKIAISKTSKI